jgi:hypothetical protein
MREAAGRGLGLVFAGEGNRGNDPTDSDVLELMGPFARSKRASRCGSR